MAFFFRSITEHLLWDVRAVEGCTSTSLGFNLEGMDKRQLLGSTRVARSMRAALQEAKNFTLTPIEDMYPA